LEITKLACELPKERRLALSFWDSTELARQLVAEEVVTSISAQTVWRVLDANKLRPWRVHHWLSTQVPRDADYVARTTLIADLYTRVLLGHEVVICVDENTNIQPRRRTSRTRPAKPGRPVQLEFEYARDGALNLFVAFNTRSGKVIGWTARRKRAEEFISFLELVAEAIPQEITVIYVVLDNLRVHKSKAVARWLAKNGRFVFHFPPVHCSWMNQVEQWFSILQRKALAVRDFDDLASLDAHICAFLEYWNTRAHPFRWTSESFAKALAKCTPPPSTKLAA
jgi:transposase